MPRSPQEICDVTWENRYGTIHDGNLPQRVTKECLESTITLSGVQAVFPWVGIDDFHYYHIKCPYSTEADIHLVRDTVKGSSTFWENTNVVSEAAIHTATSGITIRWSRGSKHGWLCVDPNCPFFLGTVSGATTGGVNYFYI